MTLSVTPRERLYRNTECAWIAGVCAGLADYWGMTRFMVRLLTILSCLTPLLPLTLLGYFGFLLLVPKRPPREYVDDSDEAFIRTVRAAPSSTFGQLRHTMRDLEVRIRRLEAHVTSVEFDINDSLRR